MFVAHRSTRVGKMSPHPIMLYTVCLLIVVSRLIIMRCVVRRTVRPGLCWLLAAEQALLRAWLFLVLQGRSLASWCPSDVFDSLMLLCTGLSTESPLLQLHV